MPVSNLVIDRLESTFGEINEGLKAEYTKTLSRFSDDILSTGMDSLMTNYQSNFRPMPGIVAKFCFQKQVDLTPVTKGNRNSFEDAKNLVDAKKWNLDKHEAYKHITPGNVRARIELSKLIVGRATIAAQAICGSAAFGYDAQISFGYNSWGGKCENIQNDISAIRDTALKTSNLDIFVPQEAVDYFNSLEDFDGEDVSESARIALSARREELLRAAE